MLTSGEIQTSWNNDTNIVLIPKVKTLTHLNDFHPINLFSVIHKIVSKLLANLLKKMLLEIISNA
jgi:hypothetical protein